LSAITASASGSSTPRSKATIGQQLPDHRVGGVGRREDHPAHPLGGEHLQIGALLRRRLVGVAEQHPVALPEGGVLDHAHRPRKVRVLDLGDDDADRLRLLATKVAGEAIRLVAEDAHGLQHTLARGRRHSRVPIQHAGDGRRRDPCLLCDVLDLRHRPIL
jgi:hypothetical protein